jgi:hypothetical protein
MSQNAILVIFAVINVIVVGVFAATILRQYVQRRREAQLYWTIALLMAFVATLAYIFMVVGTPTSQVGIFYFRLYYTLGAALTPAWLGLGSLALVTSKRVARTVGFLLGGASLWAVVAISDASLNMTALSNIAGTPGTGILQPENGPWLITIIVLNTLGVALLAGVAIYSGWQLLRRRASVAGFYPGNLLWANVLILVGALFNGAAGTLARVFGLSSSFWLVMALGWIIFYLGVLLTSKRKAISKQTKPQEPHVTVLLPQETRMTVRFLRETCITVHFPSELVEQLEQAAQEDIRSLDGEIVYAVRDYLNRKRLAECEDAGSVEM